jgi:hypothetical protein
MSLRQIAKYLGISPDYLSYMVNGKRPCQADLYARCSQLENNVSVNKSVNNTDVVRGYGRYVVGGTGLEPVTSAMSTRRSNQLS